MVEIYVAAEVWRQRRLEREGAERKRQEEVRKREKRKKRYNEEVEKTLARTNLAEDYDTACKIRSYIAAIEATGKEEMKEWIQWQKTRQIGMIPQWRKKMNGWERGSITKMPNRKS